MLRRRALEYIGRRASATSSGTQRGIESAGGSKIQRCQRPSGWEQCCAPKVGWTPTPFKKAGLEMVLSRSGPPLSPQKACSQSLADRCAAERQGDSRSSSSMSVGCRRCRRRGQSRSAGAASPPAPGRRRGRSTTSRRERLCGGLRHAGGDARYHNTVVMSLGDNISEVCAFDRGRTTDVELLCLVRRSCAWQVSCNIRWVRRYIETWRNPSDAASRLASAGALRPGQVARGAALGEWDRRRGIQVAREEAVERPV